ncbi:MAG: hypothetical protein J5906_09290 [Acidaminococcaceae bacterium]|nr:hypothetical protein [Acidaminococcaceae bacterium]
MDEEANLAYVAATRAKEYLYISYAQHNSKRKDDIKPSRRRNRAKALSSPILSGKKKKQIYKKTPAMQHAYRSFLLNATLL